MSFREPTHPRMDMQRKIDDAILTLQHKGYNVEKLGPGILVVTNPETGTEQVFATLKDEEKIFEYAEIAPDVDIERLR